MKTRDEQAHKHAKAQLRALKEAIKDTNARERLICFGGAAESFTAGWDAALASQWRDAEEELPTDSTDRDYIVRVEFNDGSGFCQSTAGYPDNHWCVFDRIISNEIEEGKCRITHWIPIPDLP